MNVSLVLLSSHTSSHTHTHTHTHTPPFDLLCGFPCYYLHRNANDDDDLRGVENDATSYKYWHGRDNPSSQIYYSSYQMYPTS